MLQICALPLSPQITVNATAPSSPSICSTNPFGTAECEYVFYGDWSLQVRLKRTPVSCSWPALCGSIIEYRAGKATLAGNWESGLHSPESLPEASLICAGKILPWCAQQTLPA